MIINFNSERWLTEVFIQYKDELKSNPNMLLSEFVRSKAQELDDKIVDLVSEAEANSRTQDQEGGNYVI